MKKKKAQQKGNLPGAIYLNKNRYWWKVKLPGETTTKARPLKPTGVKYATFDYDVAVEAAKNLYEAAVFNSGRCGDIAPGAKIITIADFARAYVEYVDEYYRDQSGQVTKEPGDIRYSIKLLVEMYAGLPIEEFGPLKLIAVRKRMIELDLSRGVINQRIGRIKRMFKWAVSRQLASPMLYQALMAVEGLQRGRSEARDTLPVKPVAEEHVYAVLPYTTPMIATMVELLLLTGMRPGELVIMRPCDIDRTGKVWHYCPSSHKTQYRGNDRTVSIGPKGQKMLRAYLLRGAESYCFSPAESEKQRKAILTENRKTPLSCGNGVGSNLKKQPKKKAGEVYDTQSFGKAVRYAVKAARKAIKLLGGDPDKELPKWTPYQLRHTAATKVRREMGYESAGAALGHTKMSATAIYAERNQGLADEAAKRLG